MCRSATSLAADYARAAPLIDAGYKAAEQNRAALLRYALDADGWKAYLDARESRRSPQPGILRQVRVEGGKPGAVHEVLADMKPIEGRPIEPASTIDALKPIQSNGGISATWETFAPSARASAAPPASDARAPSPPIPAAPAPDTGILVRLSNDRIGPPYLLVGRRCRRCQLQHHPWELDLRLVDQNLGGFGSELRANARHRLQDRSLRRILSPAHPWRLFHRAAYRHRPRAGLHLGQPEAHRRTLSAKS
jgi:NTE family protein